jgi:hypothetical protein
MTHKNTRGSNLFDPIQGWIDEYTDSMFRDVPSKPRHDFVGKTKFSQRHPNGFQYIKADDIFVDSDAYITFSNDNLNTTFPPEAYYIVCKRLIFRPRPNIPTLKFDYFLPPKAKPSTPPKPSAISGHRGSDGIDGQDGYPPPNKNANLGIQICFAFNEVVIENDLDPYRKLVNLIASGYDGQEGGDGGEGGDCHDGPCKEGGGIGGAGGNGGTGIGGGTVLIYGPQAQIDIFYRRLSPNLAGGNGGIGGIHGRFGSGIVLPQKPNGLTGIKGVDGTVVKHVKNNVLDLFP